MNVETEDPAPPEVEIKLQMITKKVISDKKSNYLIYKAQTKKPFVPIFFQKVLDSDMKHFLFDREFFEDGFEKFWFNLRNLLIFK